MPVRSAALVLLLAAAAQPQTPQEQAAARQRQSIEKQLAALRGADHAKALAEQSVSISKQMASVDNQPLAAWADPGPPESTALAAEPCAPLPAAILGPIVERAARVNSLAPRLLHAVIGRESASLPCAVSPAGAQGLMQLMPATAAGLGVADPFDPEQNVAAGSRFLRQLLDRFGGDLGLALGAYNAGPARVEAFGAIPPIPETRAYVDDILSRLR